MEILEGDVNAHFFLEVSDDGSVEGQLFVVEVAFYFGLNCRHAEFKGVLGEDGVLDEHLVPGLLLLDLDGGALGLGVEVDGVVIGSLHQIFIY